MDKDLLELFDEGIYLGYLIVNKTNGKIIKYSKNLNNLFKIDERGITNLKEIIWIGDIERFEHYIQSLTKEYKSPIEIELYMQDSTYRKLSINAKYDERESNQVIILLGQNY